MTTIYWASDSTVQYNSILTYPQTGIGQVFHLYLKPEIRVENHAKNGRSTKSFIDENRLAVIYDRMTKGDFLFIGFGHNDEKISDPARYTEPFGEYKVNLKKFINAARNKGANPVLITPLERRNFAGDCNDGKDGGVKNVLGQSLHTDYVTAMKEVGAEEGVPVIDLCTESRRMIVEAGEEETKTWFLHVPAGVYPHFPDGKEDNTHLQYKGAVKFAGIIASGLAKLGGEYEMILGDGVSCSFLS